MFHVFIIDDYVLPLKKGMRRVLKATIELRLSWLWKNFMSELF